MARVIFLHGASSAGKSTLARALQDALPSPWWHVSIDKLRDGGVLPSARFASGEFDWKAHRAAFFDGFHRSLGAYLAAGNDLILEHILDTPAWHEDLARIFHRHEVLFVALHCPLEVLEAREAARGDRRRGSAAQDFHSIHKGMIYDLELQSLDGTELNLSRIQEALKAPRRSIFAGP
ncbi:chloramphenicol phosphotransferase CPT family protein [Oceanicola sp. S124]|uniref:chloramphenicol phosphotransferase CPT family protein n=1 Tax=Oceanicola sp. S124 TaxID=1042378 RepID=UPI00025590C3|nr:AAA family ATPase [Oceanicola sp. S124]